DVRHARVDAERPGDLLLARAGEELGHGFASELGRDLARGVAAHAVADEEEAVLLDHREAIFVVIALHPNVGAGGESQLHWREGSYQARPAAGKRGNGHYATASTSSTASTSASMSTTSPGFWRRTWRRSQAEASSDSV